MRIAQLGQDTLVHTAVGFHRNVTDIQVIHKTEVMVYSSFLLLDTTLCVLSGGVCGHRCSKPREAPGEGDTGSRSRTGCQVRRAIRGMELSRTSR